MTTLLGLVPVLLVLGGLVYCFYRQTSRDIDTVARLAAKGAGQRAPDAANLHEGHVLTLQFGQRARAPRA